MAFLLVQPEFDRLERTAVIVAPEIGKAVGVQIDGQQPTLIITQQKTLLSPVFSSRRRAAFARTQ
jgi:hypothetical protein